MLLVDLLIWILVCYGLTNIVTESIIMEPVRKYSWKINKKLGELLECPMCFGFWAGILVSLAWVSPTGFFGTEWYHYILDGFIASGACWLLHTYEQSTL
tara:strand:- start:103 stop:399 length:297 start_codon:yes stop_codon:yes gene_type:complete